MSHIVPRLDVPSSYKDSRSAINREKEQELLRNSSTLYVGNLSFYTTEQQIYELFSRVSDPLEGGGVKRIIMGLDKLTPCGFAFVEYYLASEARSSLLYLSGTKLDERVIRLDLDPGYKDGRQFGRGRNGGQVRDEFRMEYDPGRGGWGHLKQKEEEEKEKERRRWEEQREREQYGVYAGEGGTGRDGGDVALGEGEDQMLAGGRYNKRGRSRGDDDDDSDGEDELGRRLRDYPSKFPSLDTQTTTAEPTVPEPVVKDEDMKFDKAETTEALVEKTEEATAMDTTADS